MDKKIIGIIGAVSALATLDVACASTSPSVSPTQVVRAQSFGELLEPIPNAASVLKAVDAAQGPSAGVQLAQYDGGYGYGHHHHHHYRPPVYYHHHHHHHHYYAPPRYHHHYQQPSYDQPSYDHEGY